MSDPVSFTSSTPRFGLPQLFAAQAQKEFVVNESLARLDVTLHCAVEGEADEPPAGPAEGECWLIGANPVGDWTGSAGAIAGWQAGGWVVVAPLPGMRIYDIGAGQALFHDGEWRRPERPDAPAGGATIDTEARAAIGNLIETLIIAGIFPAAE